MGSCFAFKWSGTGGLAKLELSLAAAGGVTTVDGLLRLAGGSSWLAGASGVESDRLRAWSAQEQVLHESSLSALAIRRSSVCSTVARLLRINSLSSRIRSTSRRRSKLDFLTSSARTNKQQA